MMPVHENEIRDALAQVVKKRKTAIPTGFKGRIIRHSNVRESYYKDPLTALMVREVREAALRRAKILDSLLDEAMDVVSGISSIDVISDEQDRMRIISAMADLESENGSYLDREVLVSILHSLSPILSSILILTGSIKATFGFWKEFSGSKIQIPEFVELDSSDHSEILEITLMRYLGATEITEEEVRKRISKMSDENLISALDVLYRGI